MWGAILVSALVAYLLGNLNGAVCVSSMMHDDVRSHGSGNAGLTNYIRNYGTARALLVVIIDAGKAVLACLTAAMLLEPYGYYAEGLVLGGLFVIIGHVFPALLGFRGGKGILSGFFVALMVDWRIALIIAGVFAIVYVLTQYVSLGSVVAAVTFGICFIVLHHDNLYMMLGGVTLAVLVVWKHRQNIVRLIHGQENKTNLFRKGKGK